HHGPVAAEKQHVGGEGAHHGVQLRLPECAYGSLDPLGVPDAHPSRLARIRPDSGGPSAGTPSRRAKASSSTSARWSAVRPVPCAICSRQLTPSAITSVASPAARTAGRSALSRSRKKSPAVGAMLFFSGSLTTEIHRGPEMHRGPDHRI